MKYVHEGREFDVAELAKLIRGHAFEARLEEAHDYAEKMLAAAALIARHEREHEALVSIASGLCETRFTENPRCQEEPCRTCLARTALRCEEAKRA